MIHYLGQQFYMTFVYENRYKFFLEGLGNTLILTFSSFILSTLMGLLLCAMVRSKKKLISNTGRGIVSVFNQIPATVMLLIMVYVVFSSASLELIVMAIFALAFKMSGYMADVFITALASVAPGEIEAARSLGMGPIQTFFNVVFPQAVKNGLQLYRNNFILTLQETSVVGYVAIQDLTKASNIVASRTFDAIFGLVVITLIYLAIGCLVSYLMNLLKREKHLGPDTVEA